MSKYTMPEILILDKLTGELLEIENVDILELYDGHTYINQSNQQPVRVDEGLNGELVVKEGV